MRIPHSVVMSHLVMKAVTLDHVVLMEHVSAKGDTQEINVNIVGLNIVIYLKIFFKADLKLVRSIAMHSLYIISFIFLF